MHSHTILAQLRDALAYLYDEQDAARVVVEDAGIDPLRVHFSDRAINNWRAILREAVKAERLDALIEVALDDYSVDMGLQAAAEAYRAYVAEHGPIRSTVPPMLEPFVGHTLFLWGVLVMGVLIAAVVGYRVWSTPPEEVAAAQPTSQPTATFTPGPTSTPGPTATPTLPFPTAAPDEYLIVVADFAAPVDTNPYTHHEIRATLTDVFAQDAAAKDTVKIRPYPKPLKASEQEQARQLGCAVGASIIIWGEIFESARDGSAALAINFGILEKDETCSLDVNPAVYNTVEYPDSGEFVVQIQRDLGYLGAFTLAQYYYALDEYDDAVRMADVSLDALENISSSGIELVYLLKGNALFMRGQNDKALSNYSLALQHNSRLTEALYNQAVIHWEKYIKAGAEKDDGDVQAALSSLNVLLDLKDHFNGYHLRGQIYLKSGTYQDWAKATEDFEQALDVMSDRGLLITFVVFYNRGLAYAQQHNIEEALTDYEQIVGVKKDCNPVVTNGTSKELTQYADWICGLAANDMAWLYLTERDGTYFEEAVRLAEMADAKLRVNSVAALSTKVNVLDTLALGYCKLGKREDALKIIEEGLLLDPESNLLVEASKAMQEPDHCIHPVNDSQS